MSARNRKLDMMFVTITMIVTILTVPKRLQKSASVARARHTWRLTCVTRARVSKIDHSQSMHREGAGEAGHDRERERYVDELGSSAQTGACASLKMND